MLADGKINEAESLLFNAVENNETIDKADIFKIAFDFYLKIDQHIDDYLELCNFSREEVNDGWFEINKIMNK